MAYHLGARALPPKAHMVQPFLAEKGFFLDDLRSLANRLKWKWFYTAGPGRSVATERAMPQAIRIRFLTRLRVGNAQRHRAQAAPHASGRP